MEWLRRHGVIGCYDDYVGLPFVVLEDSRLLMQEEWAQERKQRAEADRGHRR
jgi:hypothetical protein